MKRESWSGLAVETLAGRYELEELIGSGGMADVYRGFDKRLERRVAVKILHPSLAADAEVVERFRREARSVAKLSHPNLVSVIDRGVVDGRQYIVLEYVEGESLKQLQRRGPRPTIRRSLELAIEVGQGLAFAHAQGLVHRDVKPENVLVGKDGAKLTDFGVAYARGLEELTLTGTVLGTSYYVAPEQANGREPDARSDVYSLGVVLFELLSGDVPFHGNSFVEVAMQHLTAPPPSLREGCPRASPRLVAAVERALAKDPAQRFPSMDAFVEELRVCLAELGSGEEADTGEQTVVLPPPRRRERASVAWSRRPRPRARWLVLGGLVVVAAVAAALVGLRKAPLPLHAPGATPAAVAASVRLRAVAPYDPPPGDGVEDNARLPFATDGNPATYWASEWYASQHFGGLKNGVGIVVDAGKPIELDALKVTSDTPGYTAIIKAGASDSGPFRAVSASQTAGAQTTFPLHVLVPARYYLIWITELAPQTGPHWQVHINEVTDG